MGNNKLSDIKTKSDILIISSPFQALNAISAIRQFDLDNYEILIGENSNVIYKSITGILDEHGISNYRRINFRSFFHLIKYYFVNINKSTAIKSKNIFIGDFEDYLHLVLALVYKSAKSDIYFIDDGNKSISAIKNGLKLTSIKKYRSLNWFIKYIIFTLLVDYRQLYRNAMLYTMFLSEKCNRNDVVVNDMKFIRDKISSVNLRNGVYIIGSPSVESHTIQLDKYLRIIMNIIDTHKNELIYYIPHRRENKMKLDKLIKNKYIYWIENNTCIELFFVNKNLYPKCVYGFGSSALYTMKYLYPETETINLRIRNINGIFKNNNDNESVDKCYNALGIKTILK